MRTLGPEIAPEALNLGYSWLRTQLAEQFLVQRLADRLAGWLAERAAERLAEWMTGSLLQNDKFVAKPHFGNMYCFRQEQVCCCEITLIL